MVEFEGKTVLVTGASSGIGKATALKFAYSGARVIATSYDETRGRKIEDKLQKISSDNLWFQANILDSDDIGALFEWLNDKNISFDIAFNNASTGGGADFIHAFDLGDWKKTIDGTLTSVFEFMHYELQQMVELGEGVIINNSSVDGLRAFPFDPAYSAAKHGVLGLTKSAALQYARTGIRINAIAPGWVDTPPVSGMIDNEVMSKEEMLQHQPIGRLGKPEEIAEAVLWLASDRSSFVTGSVIPVDGGYTAV